MATLNDLITSDLQNLLRRSPDQYANDLYGTARTDILTQQQNLLENLFGRGMGRSTQLGPILKQVDEALAKARVDADTAARQATLSAVAQAAGTQQRNMAANQFQQTMDFNRQQAARNQAAQNHQMIAQGVGGLGSGALTLGGLVYGPEIKAGLRRLIGAGAPGAPAESNMAGPQGTYSGPSYGTGPDAGVAPSIVQPDIAGASPAAPDLTIPNLDINPPQFDLSNAMAPSNFSFGTGPMDFSLPTLDLLKNANWDTGL